MAHFYNKEALVSLESILMKRLFEGH